MPSLKFALIVLLLGVVLACRGETVRVAVATNFVGPLKILNQIFSESTGIAVLTSEGSSGKLYAQILHGAPYDVFLAADSERPRRLEDAGYGVQGSRFTYALGRLVLWSPNPRRIGGGIEVLQQQNYRYLALANPKTAPYGRAAYEVLTKLNLLERLRARLVTGESVAQALQFTASGNAQLGFVALAQIASGAHQGLGSYYLIPEDWHQPIAQQALILDNGRVAEAQTFTTFLRSEAGKAIITGFGYRMEN